MDAIFPMKARPGPDRADSYPKGQRLAEIVQIRPRDPPPSPLPEAPRGSLPSWSSRVLAGALGSCRRLMPSLRARHDLGALDDHLLRDIGLSRDQIQPPLLTALTANRHPRR